jgi:hypothetical protein
MIVLRDIAEIRAQPSLIFDWFRNLEDHYCDWHPDHVSCRYIEGKPFEVGSILCAEEFLHGRLHKLRLKLTSIEPNRVFRYRIAPGLNGGFRIIETKWGSQFEAEICIGWSLPIFGFLVDLVMRSFFKSLLNDLQIHMREESQNLSSLLDASGSNA